MRGLVPRVHAFTLWPGWRDPGIKSEDSRDDMWIQGRIMAKKTARKIAKESTGIPAAKKSSRRSARRYGDILYEVKDQVAWVTINRPRVMNAFREQTLDELIDALKSTRDDPSIACAVVTGAGDKAFSAGGDFYAMKRLTWVNAAMWNDRMQGLAMTIRGLAIPVIAMVNGWCMGGGHELALWCDLVIASDNAMLGQTGAKVGACPTVGATQYLPRIIGERLAREMIFCARRFPAKEAVEVGLINKCVKQKDLLKETLVLADGGAWIWNLKTDRWPQARELLDFYHGGEHLWELGRACQKADPSKVKGWVEPRLHGLRHGHEERVLKEIARMKAPEGESGRTVRQEKNYFAGQSGRMNYKEIADRGWPIGSGSVESACRQSQCRFKRPGQFWTQPGLRHLCALDEARHNDHWDALWLEA